MHKLLDAGIAVQTAGGERMFATVYPALGSDIHLELAASLGAVCTDKGCVFVDRHQRTSARGFYAAGDVVIGLDQMSHAMGKAG